MGNAAPIWQGQSQSVLCRPRLNLPTYMGLGLAAGWMLACAAAPNGRTFEAAARPCVDIIAGGDVHQFARIASKNGVVVVRRTMDWDATEKVREEGEELERDNARVWKEEYASCYSQLLRSKAFAAPLREFKGYVLETRHHWSAACESYSTAMEDHWGERILGPAAEGKLASNWFWYVYFRREGKSWRVYKLEVAMH